MKEGDEIRDPWKELRFHLSVIKEQMRKDIEPVILLFSKVVNRFFTQLRN